MPPSVPAVYYGTHGGAVETNQAGGSHLIGSRICPAVTESMGGGVYNKANGKQN